MKLMMLQTFLLLASICCRSNTVIADERTHTSGLPKICASLLESVSAFSWDVFDLSDGVGELTTGQVARLAFLAQQHGWDPATTKRRVDALIENPTSISRHNELEEAIVALESAARIGLDIDFQFVDALKEELKKSGLDYYEFDESVTPFANDLPAIARLSIVARNCGWTPKQAIENLLRFVERPHAPDPRSLRDALIAIENLTQRSVP